MNARSSRRLSTDSVVDVFPIRPIDASTVARPSQTIPAAWISATPASSSFRVTSASRSPSKSTFPRKVGVYRTIVSSPPIPDNSTTACLPIGVEGYATTIPSSVRQYR